MRRSCLLPLLLAASCGTPGKSTTPKRTQLTEKDIVNQSTDAIVRIEANDPKSKDSEKLGTGFILGKDGVIATNLHVVAGSPDIKVKLHDGTPYQVVEVI